MSNRDKAKRRGVSRKLKACRVATNLQSTEIISNRLESLLIDCKLFQATGFGLKFDPIRALSLRSTNGFFGSNDRYFQLTVAVFSIDLGHKFQEQFHIYNGVLEFQPYIPAYL